MAARARIEVERYGGRTEVVDRTDWRRRNDVPEPMALLRTLVTERAQVEARIAITVQELRQAGASWSVVGHALGCTRSAAQKRYGRDELGL
jgi:hypothetical protein